MYIAANFSTAKTYMLLANKLKYFISIHLQNRNLFVIEVIATQ